MTRFSSIYVASLLAIVAIATGHQALAYDNSPPAFLQYFEGRYETIEHRVADVWRAGYGQLWLPPPGRAETGDFSVGYDVYDRFDLGKPGRPTLYGTETGLARLGRVLHRAGGDLYVDFVVNHNGFADLGTSGFAQSGGYPGFLLTHPKAIDGDFHSAFDTGDLDGRLGGLIDIDHSTNFQYVRSPVPGFATNLPAGTTPSNGRLANVPDESNRRFYPDRSLSSMMVFDPTTGESNIAIYPFNTANPLAGDPVTENGMGLLMRYAQWMVQEIGVDGFRLDAAKHVEPWVLNYLDRAVYRASRRNHLDGSRRDVFMFSEIFDGSRGFQQTFIRKDINPSDPGRVGGNRDVLDFPLFFALQANLTNNGLANDWRDVVNAGMDTRDDGFHNGSQGVMFVQSHDSFGPYLSNVAHAYMLMHPGNAVVYYNARQFGNGRDFPKDGRGDALGGVFGDRLTRLVEIRNSHGRGDYRERWLDKEILAYERRGSAMVLLSNRGDNHYSSRTLNTAFAPGTPLIELTGNAEGDDEIPKLVVVNADGTMNVKIKPNNGGDRGYLIYGLATPQAPAGLQLTNVAGVISDPDPISATNGTTRLTDLHVIRADSFTASLQTVPINLLGFHRDAPADGDNALIRLDGGRDINSNGQVDHRTPGSVSYGFEDFATKHSDLWTGGDGEFRQTISTVGLSEGVHFLEAIAFRHRDDGGPAVYSSFKKALYIDRLPPESALEAFNPIQSGVNENRRAVVRSTDFTADSVHVFLDLPAALSDAQVLSMVGGGNRADKIDRDLFTRDFSALTHGNHVLTVVSFEPSGNSSVLRVPGQFTSTIFGAGLGDLNFDGQFSPADVFLFETALYSRNAQFSPAADLTADGLIDARDLFALDDRLAAVGASTVTQVQYQRLLDTVKGDANLDGRVDRLDAAILAANFSKPGGWSAGDFTGDGLITLADLNVLSNRYGLVPAPSTAAVPEPVTALTAVFIAIMAFGCRTKQKGGLRRARNTWLGSAIGGKSIAQPYVRRRPRGPAKLIVRAACCKKTRTHERHLLRHKPCRYSCVRIYGLEAGRKRLQCGHLREI
jgi:alpha-amylase